MSKRPTRRRLRPQGRCILEIAKRGLICVDIIHRAFYAQGDIEAARSALQRLVASGYLRSEPLDARRVYHPLTSVGSRHLTGSDDYARSFKKQGRALRYAVSWFIYADRPGQRVLINPAEYPEQFPVAGHQLPRGPFFLDRTADRPRLGITLVDLNADHRRMPRKCVMMLASFLRHGWFDTYLLQDALFLAILTFSDDRRKVFESHVGRSISEDLGYPLSQLSPDLPGRVQHLFEVHTIPQLEPIITYSS